MTPSSFHILFRCNILLSNIYTLNTTYPLHVNSNLLSSYSGVVSTNCPSGYILLSNYHCYKHYTISLTVGAANEACQADGAQLVAIETLEEQSIIKTWLSESKDIYL